MKKFSLKPPKAIKCKIIPNRKRKCNNNEETEIKGQRGDLSPSISFSLDRLREKFLIGFLSCLLLCFALKHQTTVKRKTKLVPR